MRPSILVIESHFWESLVKGVHYLTTIDHPPPQFSDLSLPMCTPNHNGSPKNKERKKEIR